MKEKLSLLFALLLFIVAIPFYLNAAVTAGNLAFENENATEWEKIVHAFNTSSEAWIALILISCAIFLVVYAMIRSSRKRASR